RTGVPLCGVDHLGRRIDPEHAGRRPAVGQGGGQLARPTAKVDDRTWCIGRDPAGQFEERTGPLVGVAKVVSRIPNRHHDRLLKYLDVKIYHVRGAYPSIHGSVAVATRMYAARAAGPDGGRTGPRGSRGALGCRKTTGRPGQQSQRQGGPTTRGVGSGSW